MNATDDRSLGDRSFASAARRRNAIAWLLLSAALAGLVACERAPADGPADATTPAATLPAAATPASPVLGASTAQTAVPSAAAVLAAIYGDEGGSSDSQTLADGREAAFWYGYRYRSGGRDRYTAFAAAAKPNESGFPAPDEQVALARISYSLDNGAWRADAAQTDVGEFGALGRAPEVDAARAPLAFDTAADRALLGVPTAFFATGATISGYALFAFEAKDGRWRYLGDVKTSEDHSANCADGPSTPNTACVRNTGTLRLDATADGAMPAIVVTRTGSARGDDGAIRALTERDAIVYRYDEAAARYVASTP